MGKERKDETMITDLFIIKAGFDRIMVYIDVFAQINFIVFISSTNQWTDSVKT